MVIIFYQSIYIMKRNTKSIQKEDTSRRMDSNGAAYLHEYVDLYAINANNIDELPVPVSFTQTRNKPFLYKPDDYYLSVVRFQIDTNSLPVFEPFIQFNQGNRNLTIYSVTLSWTNPIAPFQSFNQQNYVIWSPQDLVSPIPQPPSLTQSKFQDNSTGYYYAYNYAYFLQLINNTFTTCFNALSVQVVAAGLILPTTHSPVMTWNTDKGIAIINADVLGYNATAANKISIYFNIPMFNLFASMPAYLEAQSSALGKNYRIDTSSFGNSTVVGFPFYAPTYNALQIFQETSVLALWSPVNGIVITSNTLPINSTNIANPCVFLNGIPTNNNGNNSNVSPVITDFQAPDGLYKNSITYIPSAQYRYIDLTGNGPLYTIDINIYWRNKAGQYIPFRLSSGCAASIKILFQKKDQMIQGSTAQEFNKMV
jgi:hypothetical protein